MSLPKGSGPIEPNIPAFIAWLFIFAAAGSAAMTVWLYRMYQAIRLDYVVTAQGVVVVRKGQPSTLIQWSKITRMQWYAGDRNGPRIDLETKDRPRKIYLFATLLVTRGVKTPERFELVHAFVKERVAANG